MTEDVTVQQMKDCLRAIRKAEFKIFDIYSKNVAYGIDTETEEERQEILSWYQYWLDVTENVDVAKDLSEYIIERPKKIQAYAEKFQ